MGKTTEFYPSRRPVARPLMHQDQGEAMALARKVCWLLFPENVVVAVRGLVLPVLVTGLQFFLFACSSGEAPRGSVTEGAEQVAGGTSALAPSSCQKGSFRPAAIRFGTTPYLGSSINKDVFQEIAQGVGKLSGLSVSWVASKDYDQTITRLQTGGLEVGSLSPLAYVKARRAMPCLKLLATQVAHGDLWYSSFLLVRKDRGISEIDQLKGRTIGFVSHTSASGFLFPMAMLIRSGLDPVDIMKHAVFLGCHPAVVEAVAKGQVDAGATFYGAVQAARTRDIDVGLLRVLAITGRIPYDAIVARPDLAPEVTHRLRQAFLDLNTTSTMGRMVLGHMVDINGWVPTKDSLYEPVRETLRTVEEKCGEACK